MITTGPYDYLGYIQAAVVVCYVLLAVFVAGRNKWLDTLVVWFIAAYLLAYKFDEYGPFSSYPIDLSAMSYFVFGFAAFIPFRPLKAAGSFTAMLSGAVYFVTMTFFPNTHVESLTFNRWFLLTMAMVNHNLMFVGGLFMCARHKFGRTGMVWILGWFAFFFAYLELLTVGYGINYQVTSIVEIMQGTLVAEVLGLELTPTYYVLYYIIVVGLSVALLALFDLLNKAFTRRRMKKEPPFLSFTPPRTKRAAQA